LSYENSLPPRRLAGGRGDYDGISINKLMDKKIVNPLSSD
jgi:hypothetical protein